MKVSDVAKLYYMTPIANLGSILRRGFLSNVRAASVKGAQSIADIDVQSIRNGKRVPRGRPLHEYVNLYFNPRNPMMYRQKGKMNSICVVEVSSDVLYLPEVVITDRNAAAGAARFAASPSGVSLVDSTLTFSEFWTHPDDRAAEWDHKARMCAEVLVPDVIAPKYLIGICVLGAVGQEAVQEECGRQAAISRRLFFS